jgi:D-inositol-3-phosphate glycosyltransferase
MFATQPRPGNKTGKTRVRFAGRLSPEKGIYTLLETLHIDIIDSDPVLTFTATTAGADKPQGKIIERLLGEHPGISWWRPARHRPEWRPCARLGYP